MPAVAAMLNVAVILVAAHHLHTGRGDARAADRNRGARLEIGAVEGHCDAGALGSAIGNDRTQHGHGGRRCHGHGGSANGRGGYGTGGLDGRLFRRKAAPGELCRDR